MPLTLGGILWAVLLSLGLAGCEETGPVCYPVSGRVMHDSKPVAEAMVFFHPLDNDAPQVQRPIGVTDQNGQFVLTTIQNGDGAPAGKYAITIELREEQLDGDELVRNGLNLLPPKYSKPETSGLEYTVRTGENLVPVLHLK